MTGLFDRRTLTVRTIEEALYWVETTAHHYVAVDDEPGFIILRGRYRRLRVPKAIWAQMRDLVRPGDEFDRRMFRATPLGLERLKRTADGALVAPTREACCEYALERAAWVQLWLLDL